MTTSGDDLPDWIKDRIDSTNFDKDLTQRHVALEFVHGDRPFYNVTQMDAALGSDVSGDTVRNRLDELHERDVLVRQKINNGNVYWLKQEDSDWPIPPDVDVEPERSEPTVSEWRQEPYVKCAAASILLAIVGTAITLAGVFQSVGYYNLPVPASDIIGYGLSAGILSYIGLFLAGVVWVLDIQNLHVDSLSDQT